MSSVQLALPIKRLRCLNKFFEGLHELNCGALLVSNSDYEFLLISVSSYPLLNFLREYGFARAPMAIAGYFFGDGKSKRAAREIATKNNIFS